MQTEQKKAIIVGTLVALVCSVLVSVSVVLLKPVQDKSKASERIKLITDATGITGNPYEIFSNLKPLMVDIKSGKYSEISREKASEWSNNFNRMVKDPAQCYPLSPEQDIALIRMVPKEMMVYANYVDGKPSLIIIPVYGTGLYSVLHAYLAIDAKTLKVVGIKFYEHGETPGLGGEVDNPKWQAKWIGKSIYDKNFNVEFFITKRSIPADSPSYNYSVDALSGATLTSNGVNNMIGFWMGDEGYKNFFMQINEDVK